MRRERAHGTAHFFARTPNKRTGKAHYPRAQDAATQKARGPTDEGPNEVDERRQRRCRADPLRSRVTGARYSALTT